MNCFDRCAFLLFAVAIHVSILAPEWRPYTIGLAVPELLFVMVAQFYQEKLEAKTVLK